MRFPLPARLACVAATWALVSHHAPARCAETPRSETRAISVRVDGRSVDLRLGSLLALSVGR